MLSANPVSGQGLENIKVTLELNNETLKGVFEKIEKQTGLLFAYPHEKVNIYSGISLPEGTYTVKEVLDLVLEGTPLKYRKTKKHIIIFSPSQEEIEKTERKEGFTENKTPPDVPLVIFTIKGKVIESRGTPMAGVNIVVKGTTKGTSTDTEGNYTIEANNKDILVFSFIGYKIIETQVNERTVIDITLEEDITILDEIQINGGYYTTTQATSTGNIARVTSKEISGQPVSNPLQALQGRMTGVEIVQRNGVPGAAMQIVIRGENSLRTSRTLAGIRHGNLPLYIIDGVPIQSSTIKSYGRLFEGSDPLNAINPENIESIEILKDADATAIYGSRGANGVVLISTKKGKANQGDATNLEVSFYQGAGKANQLSDLMSSKQYLAMRREAFKNDNVTPTLSNARDLLLWDTTRHTDWQDKLFGGTANITDMQVALSGGSASTTFRFGAGYHRETTVFPGDFGYNRKSGSLSVTHKSKNEKLNGTVTVNYGLDNNDLFAGDMMNAGVNLAPVAPALYDEDGNLNWELSPGGSSTWINPLAATLISQNIKSYNLITNAVMSYEIISGLSLRTNLGYTSFTSEEIIKTPEISFDPTLPANERINSTVISNQGVKSWVIEPQLIYKKVIGESKFDLILGSTWQSSTNNTFAATGYQYASDDLLGNLGSASTVSLAENTDAEYKYNAFFGRIGYNLREKYLINLTARRDGSSRFGPNKKFANFGAVGLGWIFSNEGFVENAIPFVSFGKLRGSYGTAGSDAIDDYGYLDTYRSTDYVYQNVVGLNPFELSNPDYAWEVTKKLEAGLDLGFIEDRIFFSASWYRNRTSNQLVGYPLPNITGFPTVTANLPATVQNTGLEFTLNTVNIQSNGFRWISSINLTIPDNKLVSYPNLEGSAYNAYYIVGQPLNITKVLTMTGVNPQNGLYDFEDVHEDGFFRLEDKKSVARLGRKYYGGVSNTFDFKGFELSFLLEFVKQQGRNELVFFGRPGGLSSATASAIVANQPVSVLDRWRVDGDVSDTQKFSQAFPSSALYSNALGSNIAYSDASFLRLKTISVGYSLPDEFIQRVKLKNCRIYLQGQNLLTATKYKGFDAQNPGQLSLPALKMLSAGIQFTF